MTPLDELREAWQRAKAARDLALIARERVTDDVVLGRLDLARENAEKCMKAIERAVALLKRS